VWLTNPMSSISSASCVHDSSSLSIPLWISGPQLALELLQELLNFPTSFLSLHYPNLAPQSSM
jgi:hypothetical protein